VQGSSTRGFRVCHNGIELGRVVDMLGGDDEGMLGYEVRCGDGVSRFLPRHASKLHEGEVVVFSPLALLDDDQADFYRRRARRC
jgi:hypothetical protein